MATGPLVVGLGVTLVSAIVGMFMVRQLELNGMGSEFTDVQLNQIRLRFQRDLDAVQAAAGSIAFCIASTLKSNGELALEADVAVVIAAVTPLASTLILLHMPVRWYDALTIGPFTPFTSLLAGAYVVALVCS
ncbi:hypothetical protein J2X46_004648 [Nocardioides sp. BE266]|uniref:hypothetical protein n=1 Tax=Nocardioides sp. BE266 TaxID=2817725 RepID=UPI00285DE853|nr:hypothetical protein [Nocardioides sp. BE266]MDR7255638.1 hypothetical protein [Nocardioides sp. BE266]